MTKGFLMACLGLLLGMIGLDPIEGTPRFTYGVYKLSDGFEFILVAMGLFGIGEVLVNVEQTIKAEVFQTKIRKLLPNREEWRTSAAPIARLMVTETWYDKGGAVVASGRGAVNGLLQPGEIQIITIETPYSPKMSSNNWNFTHANGTVKVAKVKTLEAPKDPNASAQAAAAKK